MKFYNNTWEFTKALFLILLITFTKLTFANTYTVANVDEINALENIVKAGDVVILKNGIWENAKINLGFNGTNEKPIVIKAATNGEVVITKNSSLHIGGSYLHIEGFLFANGFTNKDAIITFRINKNKLANNCRVTNCKIENYSNISRLEENYWVAFYGKNNRLDHCEFVNKINIGVLIAVILDDERSRENFHTIDYNHFNTRIPLASNGGEIIRVGVSEHCTFKSNTTISNNYFYQCDGETEIVSIKSCDNIIKNNVFKECQGSLVLRHGDNNIVTENLFLGNNKKGSGGVRVINKGQWVINNYFYKCIGDGFRAPIAIMNGVPNSSANRYVAAADAVIANNSFVDCSPLSFCTGSDAERSETPSNIYFFNNLIENKIARIFFFQFDSLNGFSFLNNQISKTLTQQKINGFNYGKIINSSISNVSFPTSNTFNQISISDSLQTLCKVKLSYAFTNKIGFTNKDLLEKLLQLNNETTGTSWALLRAEAFMPITLNCKKANDIITALQNSKGKWLTINLTGSSYIFNHPLVLENNIIFTTNQKQEIHFNVIKNYLFYVKAGSQINFSGINFNFKQRIGYHFIVTDTSANSNHSNITVNNCGFSNLLGNLIDVSKSNVLDYVTIANCMFKNCSGNIIDAQKENDKKGYYNIENATISNCVFNNCISAIALISRTGNDESTIGPNFIFTNNKLQNVSNSSSLISLFGVQQSTIKNNSFVNCNATKIVIYYQDNVKAVHLLINNKFVNSGEVKKNKYVQ